MAPKAVFIMVWLSKGYQPSSFFEKALAQLHGPVHIVLAQLYCEKMWDEMLPKPRRY